MSACSLSVALGDPAPASADPPDQRLGKAGTYIRSSAAHRPADRFDLWTDFTNVHSQAIAVPNTPLHDYRAIASFGERGDVTLMRAVQDPIGFLRTPRHAGLLRSDRVRISYCSRVDGGIESGGKSARIADGAVYFRDYRGPGVFWSHGIVEESWLFVPRAWLIDSGKIAQDFDGAVFQSDHFLAKLMAQRIGMVAAHANDAGGTGFSQAIGDLRGSIEDIFAARNSDSHRRKLLAKADQIRRVKAYLARHAGETDLTPDRIADALGLSRRSLYRLLEEEGLQVSAYLVEYRLTAIAKMLRSSAWAACSIGEIGSLWGYFDKAHLARAFKRRFGVTPSNYRQNQPLLDAGRVQF
jgi:AraC-like DNA-binding protein